MKTLLIITGALALALTGGCAKRSSTYTTTQTDKSIAEAQNRTATAFNEAADKTRDAAHDVANTTRDAAHDVADTTRDAAHDMNAAVSDKTRDWRLSTEDIKADLDKSGRVVREKTVAAGDKMATGVDNARITMAIKAKYAADRTVSALTIDADTNNGVVTLKGTANSPEAIGRAIELALDTDGVHQVVSLLTVK